MKNSDFTKIPFGYKYDKEKNELILDELQANVVRTFIDLRITYLLEYREIYYLCINEKTIDEIIVDRIDEIYESLEDYDLGITNPFKNNNIIEILKQDLKIKKEILKPLIFTNKKLNLHNKKKYEVVSNKISKVIKLIEQRNDLIKKYDFKQIADTINKYNESLKNKPAYRKIKENNNHLSPNKIHKEIIEKETWEKAQNIYKENTTLEELNYEK